MSRQKTTFAGILVIGLALGVCIRPQPWSSLRAAPGAAPAERTVHVVGGDVAETDLIAITAGLTAAGHPGVFLLDSPRAETLIKPFFTRFRPERIVAVGTFPGGINDVERRWGVAAGIVSGVDGDAAAYARSLVQTAERVVVCPESPPGQLLQAACLAGSLPAPLFVQKGTTRPPELEPFVAKHKTAELIAVGASAAACRELKGARVTELADASAVARAHRKRLAESGPITGIVLANPADAARLSALAPYVALRQRAALVFTNATGSDAGERVRASLSDDQLASADSLTIVADLRAVPMEKRPNPAKGKDAAIEMEPGTPRGEEPFTLATGRLFNSDRAVVPLMLARSRLLTPNAKRKALVASNPGGGLPLLETFTRTTAQELRNAGYTVTARFEKQVNAQELRRLLPEHDLFLWEGHYKTLVENYGLPGWTEPLPPAFVFLQSCLALHEAVAMPLVDRGAIAVGGSSTRIYAATGGAFSLAYFDGLLYEDQSLGGSLRQGKNFLQCYARLKQKRLDGGAKLEGANLRSAWAFTLWGDPTLKLPRPSPSADAVKPLKHSVSGDTIVLSLPQSSYEEVQRPPYRAKLWPNGRLAGLITRGDDDDKRLVPFAFAEVHLAKAPPGRTPRLTTRVPESRWVFQWDGRRQTGYLLVAPGSREGTDMRFRVVWE